MSLRLTIFASVAVASFFFSGMTYPPPTHWGFIWSVIIALGVLDVFELVSKRRG